MSLKLHAWLDSHKPHAGARTQVLLGALVWTGVGIGLSALGLTWILIADGAGKGLLLAVPFAALGGVKSLFILDRVAQRTIARAVARGSEKCAGGLFSVGSWLLIVAMMATGQVLRHTALPKVYLGFVYVTVGTGLLHASRVLWKAWVAAGRGAPVALPAEDRA